MKYLLLTSVFPLLTAMCSDPLTYVQGNSILKEKDRGTSGDIRYFKDTRTNLCFAEVGNSNYSFTCVPCDSIKNLLEKN